MTPDELTMVNGLALISPDDGSHVEYTGPFDFTRDGGCWEAYVPLDHDDARTNATISATLANREGAILLALADGGVHASGLIEASDVIENEVLVRVNDPEWLSPRDIDGDIDRD